MRSCLKPPSQSSSGSETFPAGFSASICLILFLWLVMFLPFANAEVLPASKQNLADPSLSSVKTVHPRSDAQFNLWVEQPAEVAAYYQVSLYNETAGRVTFLEKDIGQSVAQGEKLVAIETSGAPPEVLLAPFEGVVSGRGVDPGSFVPSAAVVPGAKALLSLERNDIVTISSKMPDRIAPVIHPRTEVEIEMNGLWSGAPIHAQVSRVSPSLSKSDRTIKLEVDLYNRSESAFKDFMTASTANAFQNLKGREPPQLPKGLPEGKGAGLMPGSYGKMRIQLQPPPNELLLPSSVIHYQGGVPYVFRVDNGSVKKIPVEIDVDDGETLHLWLKLPEGGQTLRSSVNPSDEFVISNQDELEDNQPIASVLVSW